MSTVIYIAGQSDGPGKFEGEPIKIFPLVDSEIVINYETEWASFAELVPSISSAVDKTSSIFSAGGTTGGLLLGLKNAFAIQKWQNTKPPRVNVKLHFYVKNNPIKDIGQEMKDLINLHILTRSETSNDVFDVPGISLSTINEAMDSNQKDKNVVLKGKFCSIKIPGMIFLPVAMVTQCQPTYSTERTASGYPLWAILDIEFTGLFPATPDFYDNMPGVSGIQTAEQNEQAANANKLISKIKG